jgi:hypothetical protein
VPDAELPTYSDASLPIFNGDVVGSLLGVMRFPEDWDKAEIYECWRLTRGPLSTLAERGCALDPTVERAITRRGAEFALIVDEAKQAETAGTAVGAVTDAMFRLIKQHGGAATWADAIYALEASSKIPVSRTKIEEYRKSHRRVFHYWGAVANYIGNLPNNFKELFYRAEVMLQHLREWNHRHDGILADERGVIRSPFMPPPLVLANAAPLLLTGAPRTTPQGRRRGRPRKNLS